jgi:beta-glucosidase
LLSGTIVGNRIKCEPAPHVIADIKHYAMNDPESGRDEVNVIAGKRAMQKSDLLAFQIGIATGNPITTDARELRTDVHRLQSQFHFYPGRD